MAVPMKNGGISSFKVVLYVILSGVTTGVGAFFGSLIGSVSSTVISLCLAFAAGAMIAVAARELLPESIQENKNLATLGLIAGFVLMMVLDVALG